MYIICVIKNKDNLYTLKVNHKQCMLMIAYFGNTEKLKDTKYYPKKLKPMIIFFFINIILFILCFSYLDIWLPHAISNFLN